MVNKNYYTDIDVNGSFRISNNIETLWQVLPDLLQLAVELGMKENVFVEMGKVNGMNKHERRKGTVSVSGIGIGVLQRCILMSLILKGKNGKASI